MCHFGDSIDWGFRSQSNYCYDRTTADNRNLNMHAHGLTSLADDTACTQCLPPQHCYSILGRGRTHSPELSRLARSHAGRYKSAYMVYVPSQELKDVRFITSMKSSYREER